MREALRKIGLSEEEITIYTLLLRRGGAKATEVARELNQARSTTYRFLDSLVEKGLVNSAIENDITVYTAVHPQRIPEILEEKIEEVKEIMPQLLRITAEKSSSTRVELYRGTEGVKTVMRDILRTGKSYTVLGEAERFFKHIEVFAHQWIKQAEKQKMKGKLLCPEQQRYHITQYEDIRFVHSEVLSDITTWTYGDKTAQFIWTDPIFVAVVDNKEVTKSAERTFNYFWKSAKVPTNTQLQKFRAKP